MDTKKKNFVISLLRRASFRWRPWSEVRKEARVERGKYLCNICKGIHRAKDVQVDHRYPVIDPIAGWQGFDTYIDRLFCEKPLLQVCCRECHAEKTSREQVIRQLAKTEDAITPNIKKKAKKKQK